jgi:hypothetical protein
MHKHSGELREHRLPHVFVASALPGVDDAPVGVEEDEVRLVVRPELAGTGSLGVL